MVETTILKKSFEGAVSRKCCYFTAYYSLLTWYMILHVYIFYDDKSCVFVYDEYFFLNGKGVQQMLKAKKPEGGENMAADTWDCAGRVRQEQIIRTRCNLWIFCWRRFNGLYFKLLVIEETFYVLNIPGGCYLYNI